MSTAPSPLSRLRQLAVWLALSASAALLLLLAFLWWQTAAEGDQAPPPVPAVPTQVSRGEYLARIGNCGGCHSSPGGKPFAGGGGIVTPFGTVYASNLTPDLETGIGSWSSQAFWRAMHEGRSRDGRLLYPAFPYPNTTHVTREDSDAILAYLRSLPAVEQANREHGLSFPFDRQIALAAWRMLFFRVAEPDDLNPAASLDAAADSPQWRRGAYLVKGLAHCSACHAERNALGGSIGALPFGGGVLPDQSWYAPSLLSADQAGVAHWELEQIVALLTTGVSARSSVQGPMAEVVFNSTQHLTVDDAVAVATYLKSLGSDQPVKKAKTAQAPESRPNDAADAELRNSSLHGATVYADNCANCHGKQGEGQAGAYPALAGNRAVLLDPPVNLLQIINHGGFPPATAGNPRPFGMPPFGLALSQSDIASLMSFLRTAWGHQASAVAPRDVQRWMEAPSQR